MELNLTAPINDLGYGVAGLNMLKGLDSNGVSVSYWPIGQPQLRDEESASIVKKCMHNSVKFNHRAPSLRIWHQHDMAQHIGSGRRIGFPIFELDRFSELEKHHLQSLDNIIVCSEWAKSIIEKEIPEMRSKIGVVPLGVDTSIFEPQKINNTNKTVFLNVGKWEIRKGHDVLVDAFNKAFCDKDDVELWMMNHNPFLNESQEKEWHNLYLNSSLGKKIKILPRVETHAEVAQVMSIADVGIFPSRAEGWNLEALEMMALGKRVILTNYSAHTEFATEKNSSLIEIRQTEDAYDGIWFHGNGSWAELGESQVEQTAEFMRKHHDSEKTINSDGVSTANNFTWENSAEKALSFLTMMQGF